MYSPRILKHFCMRSNQLSKFFIHSDWDTSKTWFLNASTASSGVENRWPRIFPLMCGNKNKSLGAKSRLYGGWPINSRFWPVKMALVWADVWELALSWCRMIRLLLFVFRISPKISGKQIVVYHSELTVLRCSSETVATWPVLPKKQATICFKLLLPGTTFVGFGSSSNTLTVYCCFVSGS